MIVILLNVRIVELCYFPLEGCERKNVMNQKKALRMQGLIIYCSITKSQLLLKHQR